jgi:hypothetical protein
MVTHVSSLPFACSKSDKAGRNYETYLVLLVDRAHERSSWRQHLVDEDEDGLLGRQLDALADHVDELAYGEIGGYEVLLLVDGRDVRLLNLLADDGDAVLVPIP